MDIVLFRSNYVKFLVFLTSDEKSGDLRSLNSFARDCVEVGFAAAGSKTYFHTITSRAAARSQTKASVNSHKEDEVC